jgi:hypothetical protein
MDPITLDSNLAKKLDDNMRTGGTIELPFPVIYAWALSGQASYKSTGGALYYGGWASKADNVHAVVEQSHVNVPAGWENRTIATRDGGEFDAYVTRSLIVAPIGKRVSWLYHDTNGPERRSPDYIEGGRRHLQVLAYLSERTGENGKAQFVPWGPVVLTGKGYQARNLLDAFARWDKATAQLRRKVAPGVPPWCFYFALGTFGKERQVTNVGKPGAQSPITPVTAWIPEGMNEDTMRLLFVGNDLAAAMADYADQAAEWLNAWKQPAVEGQAGAGEPEYIAPPENWAPEEDVPF